MTWENGCCFAILIPRQMPRRVWRGKTDVTSSIYDVIINDVPAKDAVISTKYGDLIPSGAALAGAGIELVSLDRREFRLKDALEPLKKDYDYIFIDCPPSLELFNPECPVCGGSGDRSGAVRVLCAGGPE